MREFFKNQLQTLYTRTGFRQLENMMQSESWEKDITDLIGFMVEECDKPPFNSVSETIKMRVISRAVVEDQEFTGLNAKFVRRALSKWWADNGDRVLEQLNKKDSAAPVELTPEQNEKVNAMLESYKRRLLAGGGMTVIPRGMDPEKAAKEGAEWKSEVERKAVSVGYKPAMTAEDIQARELHMRYIQENYNARTGRPLQTWIPENEWLEKQKQGDL
jgi:hypothetical protein